MTRRLERVVEVQLPLPEVRPVHRAQRRPVVAVQLHPAQADPAHPEPTVPTVPGGHRRRRLPRFPPLRRLIIRPVVGVERDEPGGVIRPIVPPLGGPTLGRRHEPGCTRVVLEPHPFLPRSRAPVEPVAVAESSETSPAASCVAVVAEDLRGPGQVRVRRRRRVRAEVRVTRRVPRAEPSARIERQQRLEQVERLRGRGDEELAEVRRGLSGELDVIRERRVPGPRLLRWGAERGVYLSQLVDVAVAR
mmetsp:Transcript_10490/g.42335  ORF Transcript_10490/g.42335 Transcript_10490/m.42335 type:complete len:248 (+) Transcript_10490:103-846(+)